MSKHTPGPWLAERDGNSDNWNVVSPAYSGFDYFVVGHEGLYRCDGSDEANARLIAAAPDMLETLLWLDSIGGLGITVHGRIRAAINKAGG